MKTRRIIVAFAAIGTMWGILSFLPVYHQAYATAPTEEKLAFSPSAPRSEPRGEARPWGDIPLTRARFHRLQIDPRSEQPVVELLSEDGSRLLRIWIGLNEAIAIEMETKQMTPPRPMTHDLIINILKGLGATITQVVIHDMRQNTFYAYISLSTGGRDYAVDSRPSDAIALSLRVAAPIYVSSAVFARYGVEASPEVAADALRELLGADVQNLTAELAVSFGLKGRGGVLIADVEPGGRAAEGGLQRGDVILEAGGEPVGDMAGFMARFKAHAGKGPLRLKVHREGKDVEVRVKP